jgi:hypothetical protein
MTEKISCVSLRNVKLFRIMRPDKWHNGTEQVVGQSRRWPCEPSVPHSDTLTRSHKEDLPGNASGEMRLNYEGQTAEVPNPNRGNYIENPYILQAKSYTIKLL